MQQDDITKKINKMNEEANTAKKLLNSYISRIFYLNGIQFTYEHRTEINLIIESILSASMIMMDLKLENERKKIHGE